MQTLFKKKKKFKNILDFLLIQKLILQPKRFYSFTYFRAMILTLCKHFHKLCKINDNGQKKPCLNFNFFGRITFLIAVILKEESLSYSSLVMIIFSERSLGPKHWKIPILFLFLLLFK